MAVTGGVAAGDAPAPNQWVKGDEGKTGERLGAMLVYAPDLKQMLLIGAAKGTPFIQAFDPAGKTWSEFSTASPGKDGIHNYYQTAYDVGTKTVYCLSGGSVLYSFDTTDKTWKTHPAAPELEGLSWHALACDSPGKRLVVVGADKKADNLGWMRTVVYDIPAGKWTRLAPADEKVVKEHREVVAAKEALIDLVGRIRLAWYRDPKGVGTDAELVALAERCAALKKMAHMDQFAAEVAAVAGLIDGKKTLDALKAARALQRKIEDVAEAQYPVPLSRRNSPLAFEEKNKVFVLFGGDHEDYLMNDTWVLDLEKKSWKRGKPDKAPSPRAGHALCALPQSGRVALYEGYMQSSNTDYGAGHSTPIGPLQLWFYDPKADRWDLACSSPLPGKGSGDMIAVDRVPGSPAPAGMFYSYASDKFSPPALAAGADDGLVFAKHASSWGRKRPCETWTLQADPAKTDAAGRETLGVAPDQRLYRSAWFVASFCEVPDEPKDTALDKLPDNQWVKLPGPPRDPCHGCRQRDWGTCVWDSDRDQVLLWGGGHCVRSASTVVHYSPASGRIVESFDADEPYGANGGGGFDSSVLNRPWVSTHNYNHYAYDPKCKLLVAGRGYLYDPDRMDWLRIEPIALPYRFTWGSTVVETSPHGAVAWAQQKKNSDDGGLWLFDRNSGWSDLEPKGKLFPPYCDAHGMVYDSKRDRMILSGVGGGYSKVSNGTFLAFDFKTKALETLTPQNSDLAKTRNAREMAYVDHADWILIGELFPHHEQKAAKRYTRVYDCGNNKMFLLDAGAVPDGYSVGWMYDAKRKLVYAFNVFGEAWAIKLEPKTAKPLDAAP
ncbi:MAG: kelch repeat-containing protein [Planctomycetota bacterium]|nr:kelch repeat-containing protein [Planctomycetota bacterium]